MLIIGGLLALAVVAIIGAVALNVGEERAEKQRRAESAEAAMQTPDATQAMANLPPTMADALPSTMSGKLSSTRSGALTSELLHTTRPLAPSYENGHVSAYSSGQLPFPYEEERLTALDGQVHAIISELRLLALKASELEQRLSTLGEALENRQYHRDDATTR